MTPRRDDTGARAHRKGGSPEPASLTPPAGVERTCVVTRRALSPDALLPLALVGDEVVPGRAPKGRGAYVAIDRDIMKSLDARVLSRAFRSRVERFDAQAFIRVCHEAAERKVLERVGLARRSGTLVLGTERVPSVPKGSTVLLAADLADRSLRKIEGNQFLAGESLGAAAGIGWVGAMAIPPGQLAKEASYWLRVWYETAPNASEEAREGAR